MKLTKYRAQQFLKQRVKHTWDTLETKISYVFLCEKVEDRFTFAEMEHTRLCYKWIIGGKKKKKAVSVWDDGIEKGKVVVALNEKDVPFVAACWSNDVDGVTALPTEKKRKKKKVIKPKKRKRVLV